MMEPLTRWQWAIDICARVALLIVTYILVMAEGLASLLFDLLLFQWKSWGQSKSWWKDVGQYAFTR